MSSAGRLTAPERTKLTDLEGIIERGLQTFVEVGAALSLIREQRLYRETHGTFEEYCRERWGWSRQRAHQLIEASDVVGSLSTTVDTPPANEAQARELARVPAELRTEVWEQSVEESNGRPTAQKVAEVRWRMDNAALWAAEHDRKELAKVARDGSGTTGARQTKPRPNVTHILAVVEAATALANVTDDEIAALPFNALMGERLAAAHVVIGRILRHHSTDGGGK